MLDIFDKVEKEGNKIYHKVTALTPVSDIGTNTKQRFLNEMEDQPLYVCANAIICLCLMSVLCLMNLKLY